MPRRLPPMTPPVRGAKTAISRPMTLIVTTKYLQSAVLRAAHYSGVENLERQNEARRRRG
jgi:hypothetical protein